MPQPLISVQHLSRRYATTSVVEDLSFALQPGEILGLLGPNGAGKSTTMRMICGVLAPSAGRIEIAGFDLARDPINAKAQLGYLPERPPIYEALCVDEYLSFCAKLRRMPTADIRSAVNDTLSICGLAAVRHRKLGNLSAGFRQRAGIAQALVHDPKIIVLDEPTNGLDPNQMLEVRHLIQSLSAEHGVLLSSHILSEVESVCHRVLMLQQGRCVFYDTLDNLQASHTATHLSVAFEAPPTLDALTQIVGVERCNATSKQAFSIQTNTPKSTAQAIIQASVQHHWRLYQIAPEQQKLERLFAQMCAT